MRSSWSEDERHRRVHLRSMRLRRTQVSRYPSRNRQAGWVGVGLASSVCVGEWVRCESSFARYAAEPGHVAPLAS